MSTLTMALVEMGIDLAPELEQLLSAGIMALAKSIEAWNAPPSTAGTVQAIIDGVAGDHPDWSAEKKREWVRDAIAQFIFNHGGEPTDAAVNGLLEMAYQEALTRDGSPVKAARRAIEVE